MLSFAADILPDSGTTCVANNVDGDIYKEADSICDCLGMEGSSVPMQQNQLWSRRSTLCCKICTLYQMCDSGGSPNIQKSGLPMDLLFIIVPNFKP